MTDTPIPKKIIYLLDDEVITVRRLMQALRKDGYELEGFVTAAEAIARISERPPDLLITDVRLTDATGLAVLQQVKRLAPQTVVVLMTGYASINQAVQAIKIGAFNYLAKPFRLEELRQIIDRVKLADHVGVCLDTCHVHDGGYDIIHDLDGVLDEFDQVIGLHRLKTIHLNDSKNDPGSRKDRHEKIGEGTLGFAAIVRVINHPLLRDLPFFLETPNEVEGYADEIRRLREARVN